MVGHSMLLLSYGYKQRVKSNIVNPSFSHEIDNLSLEVNMNIRNYWAVNEYEWMTQRKLKGGYGCHQYHVNQALKIIIQVDFLVTLDAVRVFYALCVVVFKGIVKREWGRRKVDCSLITNMIFQYIFK